MIRIVFGQRLLWLGDGWDEHRLFPRIDVIRPDTIPAWAQTERGKTRACKEIVESVHVDVGGKDSIVPRALRG
jgi:hypothetical protein